MEDSGLLDNVTLRRWARGYRRFERMCIHFPGFKMHETEGEKLVRNVGNTLPRRPEPTLLASRSVDHSVSTLSAKLARGPAQQQCSHNCHISSTLLCEGCKYVRQQRLNPSAFR